MGVEEKLNTLLSEFSHLREDFTTFDEENKKRAINMDERIKELEDALQKLYKFNVDKYRNGNK